MDERRVAIISGAGTGIGAATAAALADRGYNVVVNYNRSRAEADEVVRACEGKGVEAFTARGNVAEDADCRSIIAAAVARWGRIDAVVNSAGATQFAPLSDLEQHNAADFQRVYGVNVVGAFQLVRAAAPHLRKNDRAAVVSVSSMGALNGNGSSYAYIASKAALNAMTLALARNLAPEIRVNAVMPGLVETRWVRDGVGPEAYERVKAQWAASSALQKVCEPSDIANAIVWLIIDATLMTGQLLTVDGGFLLGTPTKVSR